MSVIAQAALSTCVCAPAFLAASAASLSRPFARLTETAPSVPFAAAAAATLAAVAAAVQLSSLPAEWFLILGPPYQIGCAHLERVSESMERRVADVGFPALDRTDVASVQARGVRQALLRQAVASSEHPECAPEGLVFGRHGRHGLTVQEAKYLRLRVIDRSPRAIDRATCRNRTRDAELAS